MQILLFCFVSKIDVRKYAVWTASISALMVMLMGTCKSIVGMWIFFALAGLFQSGVYSSANYVLTRYLPVKYLSRANAIMNFGFAAGTVFAYCFSAICVRFDLWRLPFFVCGGIMLISVALYALCAFKAKENEDDLSKEKDVPKDDAPLLVLETNKERSLFYLLLTVFVFMVATLYYSVMNWITSLLVDVYSVSQDISIYITTLAPILLTLGSLMTIRSCDKDKDFIMVGAKYLLLALPLPFVLTFLYNFNVIFAFAICAVFVIITNGVKTIGISVVAFKMRRSLNTAQISSITNASASLAGGIAPTIIGLVIDCKGFGMAYFVIFVVNIITVLSILGVDLLLVRSGKQKLKL